MSLLDEIPVDGSLVRFTFDATVDMAEVAATLKLSLIACAILHGSDRVDLEVRSTVDQTQRRVDVRTETEPGRDLALLFLGYTRREFGGNAVQVQRVERSAAM